MQTGVDHDENFPVASWLCPAHLRPVIAAIYHFARTADDLADEGDAPPAQRLRNLAAYRQWLHWATAPGDPPPPAGESDPTHAPWSPLFQTLRHHIRQWALPPQHLHALLDAFEQDVHRTAQQQPYGSVNELLAYCEKSANPVGRLLLHLYGVNDPIHLAQSDAICSALQLINFWQDIGVDWPRQRHYLPTDVLQRHGLTLADFAPASNRPECRAAVAELVQDAVARMHSGAPLATHLPGRVGWELRLVVQGGLRIAEHIVQLDHQTWRHRPTLHKADLPRLVWRALWMPRAPATAPQGAR
jgi:squalene synthase HpnC